MDQVSSKEAEAARIQEALSADIHFLGDLLGKNIRRLAGEEAFALEEELRAAAKALRAEPSVERARAIRDRLDRLDLASLRTLIRSFSIFFDLTNLAEQQARVRAIRWRTLQRAPEPIAETPEAALSHLRSRGISASQVRELLSRALVCPVFTAHPSEARRRTILEKLIAIARQMDRLEYTALLPRERDRAIAAIGEEVETYWLTETVRLERPTALIEVRHVLEVVEGGLIDVVLRIYRGLERALQRVYPEESWRVPALLRFGSWIGGDRDGNPNVTHATTVQAVRLQQETMLRIYVERIHELGRHLSHSRQFIQPTPELLRSLDQDVRILGDRAIHGDQEPVRAKCQLMAAKAQRTLNYLRAHEPTWSSDDTPGPQGLYLSRADLLTDLTAIEECLKNRGALAAAGGMVRDLIRIVEVFGMHLLTLDIRQHSSRHAQALDEIFASAGVAHNYIAMSAEERFRVLAEELERTRPLIPTHLPYGPETQEVVRTFRSVAAQLERHCPEAVENYVISSTTEPAHLLEVLLLAREARLFRPAENVSRLNVVPLFESLAPLQEAERLMERVFELPAYRQHLRLRGDIQEVMIGYSDSNKESGILQSAWALHRSQRRLCELGDRTGVRIQVFHGRGGAIGRGGGPANRAILAQPRGTIEGRLRITEQGEMIADRYGHDAIAERHLEQVLNAVLRTSFPLENERADAEWVELVDELAVSARGHYRALVYETPEFLTYFEQATPIEEIGQLKIGSRPARRGQAPGIEELRAIPWVFSWMQSRHTLPGWYGLGSAVLDRLDREPTCLATLRAMYDRWPFWRTLIDNVQMILAKADATIARLYADLVEDQELADRMHRRIFDEHARTVDAVLRITGQKELLERAPVLQHSIQRRNPYVDPLSYIQLVILKRLRAGQEPRGELLTAALESINGISSGLKNTG